MLPGFNAVKRMSPAYSGVKKVHPDFWKQQKPIFGQIARQISGNWLWHWLLPTPDDPGLNPAIGNYTAASNCAEKITI